MTGSGERAAEARQGTWAALSDGAQSVLENLLGHHDDEPQTLLVQAGAVPRAEGRRIGHGVGPVGEGVFSEISGWVQANRGDFSLVEAGEGWLRLRLEP